MADIGTRAIRWRNYAAPLAARSAALLLCASFGVRTAIAAGLPADAQRRVGAATFEVVMEKPQRDSLTYEKPLPLDLLPYTLRTDKYQSVGTAFAIGDHRYVSAAHVFSAGFESQLGEPALRDGSGAVFVLDKVVKYASNQDFIVFTLKNDPATDALPVARDPKVGEQVFAVGNALGEGVVVRDGLLTSLTPEELDGRWKWIRFSAAASPGNSGGPLLDEQGRVIGVVLRKSPNENLNYAAPISLVLDAPDGRATLDGMFSYWMPIMDTKENRRFQEDFAVPSSYAELSKEVTSRVYAHYEDMQKSLLAKNAAEIFPRGEGSQALLHSVTTTAFPFAIQRGNDGTWDAVGSSALRAELPRNGFVSIGGWTGGMLARIRKPDDVGLAALGADSRQFMDDLLKVVPLKRTVGPDEVRITSLGVAHDEPRYTDAYGRQWQVRIWNSEQQDAIVVGASLQVPDGYIALLRPGPTSERFDALLDLRASTNFVYFSLNGTLEQWTEYLRQGDSMPQLMSALHIDYEYGKRFHYGSKRFEARFDKPPVKIDKDSTLTLQTSYFDGPEGVVWDVAGFTLSDKGVTSWLSITRHARPPATLPDKFQTAWSKMVARDYPYDASLIEASGTTSVDTIYPFPASSDRSDGEPNVLYEVSYGRLGQQSQDALRAALAEWCRGLEVFEK